VLHLTAIPLRFITSGELCRYISRITKEAQGYFEENILTIGDKHTGPEKYNLYYGLYI